MPDLRALIRARAVVLHGGREQGSLAALARRLAPRWGLMPSRAAERLSRFLGGGDMPWSGVEVLLDVVGLEVRAADQAIQENRHAPHEKE